MPGDEVLVSIMEHHSNLLVWQQAAKRTGATLRYLDCTQDRKITAEMVEAAITDKTKNFRRDSDFKCTGMEKRY